MKENDKLFQSVLLLYVKLSRIFKEFRSFYFLFQVSKSYLCILQNTKMNKRYLRDSKCQSLFVSEKLYDFTIPPYTLYMQYTNAIKRDFITDLRLSLTIIHETILVKAISVQQNTFGSILNNSATLPSM